MTDFFNTEEAAVPNQFIGKFSAKNISVYLKREDLLHPEVSGNKFRKLKYNIQEAIVQGKPKIVTFGGAFSNHIAATAAAGKLANIGTLGVIRGEELAVDLPKTLKFNPTLRFASSCGMKLKFISREEYRNKENPDFLEALRQEVGDFYLVPEGGTNQFAIKGCEEILQPEDNAFNYICTSVGTGGTVSGIINSSSEDQKVVGFSALKGDFLTSEVKKLTKADNWQILTDFHFGGYAKVNRELIDFINNFRKTYHIQLDPVYTSKLLFGIFAMIENGYFPDNAKILAIHTGGLQGIDGMNRHLAKRNLPLIED
ncbi:1-aminocyclopropane-1-carboxylate deaminase/D-cysteine desulfhydrase [Autumnicola psychrophila]|uniref:Pyridoxal-phosphate dependent enzyme n=1 Tax=Autumnicola psychrophila TaxID=3075592 RepID=A0ABU3DWL3_9FLAO|nr:pyridoxal-phosphate dependent enzyme [Zunongwangia sp. F225]MDT0688075.1 pyridoxal-phosphate dependent enzyme [Zunongwangia sp. F225]